MSPTARTFGHLPDGREVQCLTIADAGLEVEILTWGAALRSLRLPGIDRSLTLGLARLEDFFGPLKHHGTLVGPVANRIASAQAEIDGRTCRFDANEGANTLHSGAAGTHLQLWTLTEHDPRSVRLALDLPDGAGGFPGNRHVSATYEIAADATLRLTIEGTTDRPSPLNVTNHAFWNLDGTDTWEGHILQIGADHVLELDADNLPTGEIIPLDGHALDFRQPRKPEPGHPALDHNFCLSGARMGLRPVARLTGQYGVSMTLATTESGLQVYDNRRPARPGRLRYEGIALEPQGWPDALTHPEFPPVIFHPGQTYTAITEWAFGAP